MHSNRRMNSRFSIVLLILSFSLPAFAQSETPGMRVTRSIVDQVYGSGALVLRAHDLQAASSDAELVSCIDESCLQEVANATKADLIVFGQLREKNRQFELSLMTYDSALAARATRDVLTSGSIAELRSQLSEALTRLIVFPDDKDVFRVLVMDIAQNDGKVYIGRSPMVSNFDPTYTYAGFGLLGLGVAAVAGGGGLGFYALSQDQIARDATTLQKDIPDLVATRDTSALVANILFIVGGVSATVGGTILAVSLAQGVE